MPSVTSVDTIEAVLKITERCNINCRYCYMFNLGYQDFHDHPAAFGDETMEVVARFLGDGARDLKAKKVRVDLHGGEPTLMKRGQFEKLCTVLRDRISPHCELELSMQTNGMLIDAEWIRLFSKYQVHIGVSIDGPPDCNDLDRLDHQGRSTFEKTVRGFRLLQQAARLNLISEPGILAVANPTFDGRTVYRYFVDELGCHGMDFLLPMESHDDTPRYPPESYGRLLCDIYDEWAHDDDQYTRVRFITRTVSTMMSPPCEPVREPARVPGHQDYLLLTIDSSGGVGPDDDLKPINFRLDQGNVRTLSLVEFASSDACQFFWDIVDTIPADCSDCVWRALCRGQGPDTGRLITRFSRKNGFNNRSLYCESWKTFFNHVLSHVVRSGISVDQIAKALDPSQRRLMVCEDRRGAPSHRHRLDVVS